MHWKTLGFSFATAAASLALLADAHFNSSDDWVYYDHEVYATTWDAPTAKSNTNSFIKRNHPVRLAPVATIPLFRSSTVGLWSGLIEVGTPRPKCPRQSVWLVFDTGSESLWVASSNTPKSGFYASSQSSTWWPLDIPFAAYYADGSCTGVAGSDIVNVGGIKATMSFGSVSFRSTNILEDGILGLSLSPSPEGLEYHFLYAAQIQNRHFNPIAAFCFGTEIQELHLGQVKKKAYVGEKMERHPVIQLSNSPTEFWTIGRGEISVGTTVIQADIRTILDTGSLSIFGPLDEVRKIYSKIAGSRHYYSTHGDRRDVYTLPCNHKTEVSFKWGNGDPWVILPRDLFQIGESGAECQGVIQVGSGLPAYDDNPETLWQVGEPFMRGKYVVHNSKERVVELAKATARCGRE